MSLSAGRFAQESTQHAIAILQADLPPDLRSQVLIGDYLPGLVSQLPFVTVTATIKSVRSTGIGGAIGVKQERIDGALVDLGEITGATGVGELTLTLWAVTRPQLATLRDAITALTWPRRARQWEAPAGVLNRALFLTCSLANMNAAIVAPLPPAPPHFTINANNTDLLNAPVGNAIVLGQAQQGQTFEVLGRTTDAAFVQGCCFNGQPFWVAAAAVTTSLPLTTIPVITPPAIADPSGAPRRRRRAAPAPAATVIDPGTAILATAATTPITAWRQDLLYTTHLELTQEPLTGGELIEEVRLTQQLGLDGAVLQTERLRISANGAQVVN
ncbi:MAG: hypothetical protein DYG89_20215 [Caldilinea sp. CFX5]|nr:hypothetical protein [Caldilinea sp. CFX5]